METARLFSRPDRPSGCLVVLSLLHSAQASEAIRAELIAKREQHFDDLARRLLFGLTDGELAPNTHLGDGKSVVRVRWVSVRVDLGGGRIIRKNYSISILFY